MKATARIPRTRFGAFEVDLRSGELYKSGIRLKLQDQPFQVLALLLEQPGEVVTRQELREKLWPGDTFVDFDTGLNSAVRKLRDALSDSAEEPHYIETLPRRGYRFIARVENGNSASALTTNERLTVVPLRTAPHSWKRRRFVFALGLAILLAGIALVGWRVLVHRPALTGSDVIVLTSFVNKTGDPIFDSALDKALEVKLSESPFLSLLSEADVGATMRTMRHSPDERVTQELGIEICKRRGLKAVVVPEIAAIGSKYLITLDAIDAATEESIAREQEEAKNRDDVIASLGRAGSHLRRRLGESLTSLQKYNAPLDLVTTSSLEALQAYRSGLTLYRSGKRKEAIPFFEKAVELDAQFCSAYDMLGRAQHSVGESQESNASFAKAFALKDRHLTQEENFQTTALYYSSVTGNLDKELAEVLLYREIYPRSVDAANFLGIVYAQLGKTEEALTQFQWAIEHSPVPSAQYNSNASQALMILGRLGEAKNNLDQWRAKASFTPFQVNLRYRIADFENDVKTMDSLAHEASAGGIPWIRLQENLAFRRGDIAKLRSLSDGLVSDERRANHMENVATELAYHADEEAYLGNYALAQTLCAQASDAGNQSGLGLMKCAKALGEAGDAVHADALANRMSELYPDDTFQQKVLLAIVHSTIARARGNSRLAVDLLSPATEFPNVVVFYNLGLAHMAAGDSVKAVVDFKAVLDHPGWPESEVFAPLAQVGLAKAYAAQGEQQNSHEAYEDFFKMWNQADADIPILRRARTEYKAEASSSHQVARVRLN